MRKSKWFTGRFSLRGVYVLGCVIYASVFVAWAFVKDPVVIAVLNGFEGVGFALLYVSGVMVVGKLVPKHLQATGQSMMQMVGQGLGPVLGASIGGVIYGRFGPPALFLGAAASTLLAAIGDLVHAVAARVLGAERRARGPSRSRMTRSGCPPASPRRAPR